MTTKKKQTPAPGSNDSRSGRLSVLHGPHAYDEYDSVSQNLYRAAAMADVLNVAAFAEIVTINDESFQDYMTNLASLIHEVLDVVKDWEIGK